MKHKDLAKQAGFHIASSNLADIGWVWCSDGYPIDEQLERFAELVRQDYAKQFITDAERDENIRSEERRHCAEDYLKIMRDAVAREREACAKLVEKMAVRTEDIRRAALEVAAKNIRARGNT